MGERGGGGSEREEEAVVVVAYRTRYIHSSDQLMASFFRRLPRGSVALVVMMCTCSWHANSTSTSLKYVDLD